MSFYIPSSLSVRLEMITGQKWVECDETKCYRIALDCTLKITNYVFSVQVGAAVSTLFEVE